MFYLIPIKHYFQARVISTGELAAVKVVKVEPGKQLVYKMLTVSYTLHGNPLLN